MAATLIPEEVKATHADRPQPRRQLPFRVVSKGRFHCLQWDASTIGPHGTPVIIPFEYSIEETPGEFGLHVARLQERCAEVECYVDGLLSKIDAHITDKLALEGKIKSLEAQLAEAKRQVQEAKQNKNGRRD
jgi:hypothetical protein